MDITSYVMGMNAGKKSAGGGGSGSGVLPAGCYLSVAEWGRPSSNRYKVFKYAGKMYATSCSYTGMGYMNRMYAFDEETGSWSLLLSSSSYNGLGDANIDTTGWSGAEYNGKFHFIDEKSHAVFDGSEVKASTSLPTYGTNGIAVYNGKLYGACYNDGLYEWDDANSLWIEREKFDDCKGCIVCNNKLYVLTYSSGYKLNLYNEGTLEKIVDLEWNLLRTAGGKLYSIDKSYGWKNDIYEIDVEKKETILVGQYPEFKEDFFSENTDDISFAGITNSTTASCVPFFKVNIIK